LRGARSFLTGVPSSSSSFFTAAPRLRLLEVEALASSLPAPAPLRGVAGVMS
jgi:hypothetical protein